MGTIAASFAGCDSIVNSEYQKSKEDSKGIPTPLIISTWPHILDNQIALKAVQEGNLLDGIEKGINNVENNPLDQSVGIGGRPDRSGTVTLDACIMDKEHRAGSVCYLKDIKNPISVARLVMEDTPHVILAGDGALQFALDKGFQKENLLTEKSKAEYVEWLKTAEYKPKVNVELHDTIGMLAIDQNGDISGGCSTSGLGYKMQGRVGDSPIIGAGLFVDNEAGAATATGMGELVLTTLGSFLTVEFMRQGMSPLEACKAAVMRTIEKNKDSYKEMQVGYVALDKYGRYGAYSIQPGFQYTVTYQNHNKVYDAQSYLS
ncbi:N(4)-(beta-N-acetylglucosaminyl)-L-asparaginase [Saprospiraceae bacterium]|nr:N(4)-(beta-N-acetylglucosaminyl)-L-asparaginase [Saprospiraceae bacterium]MDB4163214.1 N(4)-(beta-N-acetylglucosaminyl)-L-asparaginase [Saprospiraceae bacterium]MDC1306009.1 N(4)-(beta-N-acetylglucosaminyl)-L-asparaginase [Saprospiraceae bacterium]MDC1308872.1 N(4)-(beta-N-acetylglucosaminyl)-L-asparaginase [Saprospiraceae bacterium]